MGRSGAPACKTYHGRQSQPRRRRSRAEPVLGPRCCPLCMFGTRASSMSDGTAACARTGLELAGALHFGLGSSTFGVGVALHRLCGLLHVGMADVLDVVQPLLNVAAALIQLLTFGAGPSVPSPQRPIVRPTARWLDMGQGGKDGCAGQHAVTAACRGRGCARGQRPRLACAARWPRPWHALARRALAAMPRRGPPSPQDASPTRVDGGHVRQGHLSRQDPAGCNRTFRVRRAWWAAASTASAWTPCTRSSGRISARCTNRALAPSATSGWLAARFDDRSSRA